MKVISTLQSTLYALFGGGGRNGQISKPSHAKARVTKTIIRLVIFISDGPTQDSSEKGTLETKSVDGQYITFPALTAVNNS